MWGVCPAIHPPGRVVTGRQWASTASCPITQHTLPKAEPWHCVTELPALAPICLWNIALKQVMPCSLGNTKAGQGSQGLPGLRAAAARSQEEIPPQHPHPRTRPIPLTVPKDTQTPRVPWAQQSFCVRGFWCKNSSATIQGHTGEPRAPAGTLRLPPGPRFLGRKELTTRHN